MTCKNCRYWKKLGWPDDLWGKCLRTRGVKGASEDDETLAWVESFGETAWLNTYENFECNQGKSREE